MDAICTRGVGISLEVTPFFQVEWVDDLGSADKRFEDILEAMKVVIELDSNKWMERRISDHGEAFLKSVARRAKEFLMWKLVADEHIGVFPKEIVWEGEDLISSPTHYKVVATDPKGELQVMPKTQVVCRTRQQVSEERPTLNEHASRSVP